MHAESEENRNNYKVYFENFDKTLKPLIDGEINDRLTNTIVHKSAQALYMD